MFLTLDTLTEDILERIGEYFITNKADACMLMHLSTRIWLPHTIQKICLRRNIIQYSDGLKNMDITIRNKLARDVELNDFTAPTLFDAGQQPDITIANYATRLFAYSQICEGTFIIAIILLDRLLVTDSITFCYKNAHRLILTAVLVASKVHLDDLFSNEYYAMVGGVTLGEINTLEREFLSGIKWDISVTNTDFQKAISTLKK